MNKRNISCRVVAFLILLTILLNWQNVTLMFHANTPSFMAEIFLITITTLFLLLNLIAALGLFFTKWWGFWSAYFAIIFSTIFFSTAYIPFVDLIGKALPTNLVFAPMLLSNVLVLALIIYLHIKSRRAARS